MKTPSLFLSIILLSAAVLAEPAAFEGTYVPVSASNKSPAVTSFTVKSNKEGTLQVSGKSYKGSGTFGPGDAFDFQTATAGAYSYHLNGKFAGKVFSGTLTQQGAGGEKSFPIRLQK